MAKKKSGKKGKKGNRGKAPAGAAVAVDVGAAEAKAEPAAKADAPVTPAAEAMPAAEAKPNAAAAPTASGDAPSVDAKLVKQLRDDTGAKMMECKKALIEAGGDLATAKDVLRKRGQAGAAKRAGRETTQGAIGSYIHGVGRIGVMVELGCESDFVARNEEFQELLKDLCMHVAAAMPTALTRDEVPAESVEREREIAMGQIKGKPENVVEKIVSGKVDKFYSEIVLLEQPFVKETKVSVGEHIQQKIAKIGENITVKRFVRWELGGE